MYICEVCIDVLVCKSYHTCVHVMNVPCALVFICTHHVCAAVFHEFSICAPVVMLVSSHMNIHSCTSVCMDRCAL